MYTLRDSPAQPLNTEIGETITMSGTSTPKPEPADVRFAVTITNASRDSFSDGYRYFRAEAYVLGVDPYGKTGLPELRGPDEYGHPDSVRALKGLVITAQSDNDHMRKPGGEWYAWEVKYDRFGGVELKDAEEMLPVLRKIRKTMERLNDDYGRYTTLAQFCTYAVKAVIAPKQRRPFMRHVPDGQDYEGHGYRSMDTDALAWHIQADAQKWREDRGIKPAG
jgi:hypothetical protein